MVEEVRDTEIIVTRIFELALDRLLIDISFDKESRKTIGAILNNTSIPRYRIFRQWSEATDIVWFRGNYSVYPFYDWFVGDQKGTKKI